MSNWQQVRGEALRKQAIINRQIALLQQQKQREDTKRARYFGDNLK